MGPGASFGTLTPGAFKPQNKLFNDGFVLLIVRKAVDAIHTALQALPAGFPEALTVSIIAGLHRRLHLIA